jgi:hypothetical protein
MYDELRKLLVRDGMKRKIGDGRVRLTNWWSQNTYY